MHYFFLSLDYRLVQFIDSYDPPLKGLQEDLNFVSPRIGEVNLILYFIKMVLHRCLGVFLFHLIRSSYDALVLKFLLESS